MPGPLVSIRVNRPALAPVRSLFNSKLSPHLLRLSITFWRKIPKIIIGFPDIDEYLKADMKVSIGALAICLHHVKGMASRELRRRRVTWEIADNTRLLTVQE